VNEQLRVSMPLPPDARARPRLSIVAPCYNEEAGLEEFHRRMTAAAKDAAGADYELILVNDGSADRTWQIMRELAERDPQLVAVNLSRRHGHQRAMTAGLHSCRGVRLMSRKVIDILNSMPEQQRFIRGMVSWIGLRQVALAYDRAPRTTGSSNYSLGRMFGLAFDALTSFSIMPLRLASYLGIILGFLSLLMLGYTLGSWAFGHVVEGWTSLSTLILVLGSMQLILFGLLGEYVGRLYLESKRRPLFVIDEIRTGENVSGSAPYHITGERPGISGETLN
jgi:hypothetical protein